jgi:hypothetical protein
MGHRQKPASGQLDCRSVTIQYLCKILNFTTPPPHETDGPVGRIHYHRQSVDESDIIACASLLDTQVLK